MNLSRNKILAVAPSSSRLGIVVFRRKELIYFAVKTFKLPRTGKSFERELSKAIRRLIKDFSPRTVVIKRLDNQQIISKKLQLVRQQVVKETQFRKIPLEEVPFKEVKKFLCPGDEKPTSINAFKALSLVYPELKQFVNHVSPWQAEYYNSLLTAAATGFYILSRNSK